MEENNAVDRNFLEPEEAQFRRELAQNCALLQEKDQQQPEGEHDHNEQQKANDNPQRNKLLKTISRIFSTTIVSRRFERRLTRRAWDKPSYRAAYNKSVNKLK
uniref:Uncharacterized protein n=1 Tax=Trichuris muris TaxID=70415 RepID=A0A5S6QPM2_TRIMR